MLGSAFRHLAGVGAEQAGTSQRSFRRWVVMAGLLAIVPGIVGAQGEDVQRPAGAADPATLFADPETAPPAPVSLTPRVALLLPLSGRQQALGAAVRDGFLAAHFALPPERRLDVLVLDDAGTSTAEAYRVARASGAEFVVGPLLKESVQALAALAGPGPVLALNFLPEGQPAPPAFWQFGLAPEDEARAVARLGIARNQRRALSLVPDSEWGRRLGSAFAAEYITLGGEIVDTATYFTDEPDLSPTLRRLLKPVEGPAPPPDAGTIPGEITSSGPRRRTDVDLLFLVSNAATARQIAPQLRFFGAGDLPTYSTSSIWEEGHRDNTELNGIMFPDSPWVIAPDGPALAARNALLSHWGRPALNASRFYALGFDAYNLLPVIGAQQPAGPFVTGEVSGVTGRLNADTTGRIHRRLAWAQIREGQPMPFPTADGPSDGPVSVSP